MATSGTYNFANISSKEIIEDAFLRIGILPNVIENEQTAIAQRTINIILTDFMNKGLNQWTLKSSILTLNIGQPTYPIDINANRIIIANIRTSIRVLGGTAFSSAGGIAQNAFDGNPATACTQTSPNGYISYNYSANNLPSIKQVGIQSNVTTTYTLVCEVSNDNINWTQVLSIPAQTYTLGINIWFVINTPMHAQYFRVRETGGATLDVQELYFNNTIQDRPITEISDEDYYRIPFKNQIGTTSSYYFDRQIQPTITLWPVPNGLYYNSFFYRYSQNIQDIGTLLNQPQVPQRFFQALISLLAYQLAIKYAPDKISYLKAIADEDFNRAAQEDSPETNTRIYGDYLNGWGR